MINEKLKKYNLPMETGVNIFNNVESMQRLSIKAKNYKLTKQFWNYDQLNSPNSSITC